MRALSVVGMGFGDCSKGATVDKLCRELPVDTIVRMNGGAQAAHNVVTPEGVHHTFSQFGSGMIASQTVKTHLSRFMLVEPMAMMREANKLNEKTSNVWWRTTVDAKAVIVTPYHRMLNRLRERALGDARHGSCGRGIGVAREMHIKHGDDVLLAGDTSSVKTLFSKLCFVRDRYWEEIGNHPEYETRIEEFTDISELVYQYAHWPATIVDSLEPSECMVFEGAQGVMLDETHGTAPHNTWTDTTFNNADTLLDEIGVSDRYRIGCLRTYHTRHGAGPFPTENPHLLSVLPEPHNGVGEFQGAFRVGAFDFELAQKAIEIVGGIDGLSMSHLDCLPALGMPSNFAHQVADTLDVPLAMTANGPTATHRTLTMDRKEVNA